MPFITSVNIKERMISALLCASIGNTIAFKNNEWYKSSNTRSIHDGFRSLTRNEYTTKYLLLDRQWRYS